ncbi:MAG: hypothetical protein PHT12_01615 [Patescibacteria group bacterium]|nr:hypothetical protein [Patescibacteria group bacterium]
MQKPPKEVAVKFLKTLALSSLLTLSAACASTSPPPAAAPEPPQTEAERVCEQTGECGEVTWTERERPERPRSEVAIPYERPKDPSDADRIR